MNAAIPFGEKKLVFTWILLSSLAFLALVPFAKLHWTPLPAFIPAYESALFFNGLITAFYFFCQFIRINSRGSFVLGLGYLYDALMVLVHGLSFPDVFSKTGLISGNSQTTSWLYMFWHVGFPLFVIAYALIRESQDRLRSNLRNAIILTAGLIGVVGLVLFQIALVTTYIDYMPLMLVNNSYRPALLYTISTIAVLAVISLILLGRKLRTAPTILDLWLTVVLSSWLYDVGLSSLFNNGRWDLGFYVGRVYGLVSAGFVLVMLIIETTRLNERLSVATTQLKENNDTLEARVQERTEELADIMKQLSQAQKMEAIGNLTGGIAHDFNNMLAIIIGSLDVIRETAYDKETDELLQDVLSAALRGSDMTKRLLAFAKKQPLKPQITAINVLIYSLIDLLDRTLGSRITITLSLGEDIWPVLVDPPLLEAALTNLVTNARDAMPNGGHITIATSNQYIVHQIDMVTGDYAMIEFSDTGTGMPPEVVEHIFEPFYTTKEPGKGTGLGLSMVFGFMKQSGGHISVTSELGVGTTFRLYLPRAG